MVAFWLIYKYGSHSQDQDQMFYGIQGVAASQEPSGAVRGQSPVHHLHFE